MRIKLLAEANPKLVTATVTSPFIGVAVGSFASAVLNAISSPAHYEWTWTISFLPIYLVIYAAYVGATVGIAAMLALGLPTHALLTKLRWSNIFVYALAGAAIGAALDGAIFGLMSLVPNYSNGTDDMRRMLPFALCVGLSTSTAFWFIRRPDRAIPNPATPAP